MIASLCGLLIKIGEFHLMTEIWPWKKNVHYLFYGPNKIQFQMHFGVLSVKRESGIESCGPEHDCVLVYLLYKFILLRQNNQCHKMMPKESYVDSSFVSALTGSSGVS